MVSKILKYNKVELATIAVVLVLLFLYGSGVLPIYSAEPGQIAKATIPAAPQPAAPTPPTRDQLLMQKGANLQAINAEAQAANAKIFQLQQANKDIDQQIEKLKK